MRRVHGGKIKRLLNCPFGEQLGDSALVWKGFSRNGREITEAGPNHLSEVFILVNTGLQIAPVGKVGHLPNAVHQDDALEALVGLRVANDGKERREPGAGREKEEISTRVEITEHQGADRLLPHQDRIALLDVLKARGERTVVHFDRKELEFLGIVRARD